MHRFTLSFLGLAFGVLVLPSTSTADVLPATASWSAPGGNIAYSIDGGGDVDGDGYDDLFIGSPSQGLGGVGRVYHGNATGLSSQADWTYSASQPFDGSFGRAASLQGDVNGDGYDDLVVSDSAWGNSQNLGRVALFLGSASGLSTTEDWAWENLSTAQQFGMALSTSGDVNGDGFDDLVVGAPGFEVTQGGNEGKGYLFLGSATGFGSAPDWTVEGTDYGEGLGASVAIVGDINGDGLDDLALSAPWYMVSSSTRGRIHLFWGTTTSLSTSADLALVAATTQALGYAQEGVTRVGDVDDDGIDDLFAGSPSFSSGDFSGAVWLFPGATGGPAALPTAWFYGPQYGGQMGTGLSGGRDVDGDGIPDMVGAAFTYVHPTFAISDSGHVWLFLGAAGAPSMTPAWEVNGV